MQNNSLKCNKLTFSVKGDYADDNGEQMRI